MELVFSRSHSSTDFLSSSAGCSTSVSCSCFPLKYLKQYLTVLPNSSGGGLFVEHEPLVEEAVLDDLNPRESPCLLLIKYLCIYNVRNNMIREANDNSQQYSGIAIDLPIPTTNLFKHKATNDVLLFLSRNSFEDYTISEIATYTEHTEPSVKRAVDVLSENDLIKDTPEGNRRLIEINRDRLSIPDDPYLQIPQTEFQKPAKTAAEEIKSRLENVQAIILYGSVARGEADRRSDIDLWILVSGDRPEQQRKANEIRKELEEKEFDGNRYGFDIDVESVSSVPKYTEELQEIVLSGITLSKKENFVAVRNLIEEEARKG